LGLVAGMALGLWQCNVWAGLWMAAISILVLVAARLAHGLPLHPHRK
jgi:hypothetical protein